MEKKINKTSDKSQFVYALRKGGNIVKDVPALYDP